MPGVFVLHRYPGLPVNRQNRVAFPDKLFAKQRIFQEIEYD